MSAPENFTDDAGITRLRGRFAGGGSLPQGWTGDEADPQNVDANGATLTVGNVQVTQGGSASVDIDPAGVQISDSDTGAVADLNPGNAAFFDITPATGSAGVRVNSGNGATAAVDADTLPITNVADPTNAQDADTKAARDAAIAAIPAGGLPTGWDQAGDPADVTSNGGGLDLGGGALNAGPSAFSGAVSLGNNALTDVADPSDGQDAVTKAYLENNALLTPNNVAPFVANGSTVDQLRDALILAGLMAAS